MEVDVQGRYTGERDERPAIHKGMIMDELSERCSLVWTNGSAFGDSPTDIDMYMRCKYRFAINPTQELQKYMRDNPDNNIVWVNDHQKTGT